MRRLVAILCWLCLATTTLCWGQDPYARVAVGDKAPDFSVRLSDGSQVTLSQQQGKVVWILFWASWCPSCRKEVTYLDSRNIVGQLNNKLGDRFLFLPIAREENSATVGRWMNKRDIDLGPYACDIEREVYALYAEQEIPRNIIVAPDGTIAHTSSNFARKQIAHIVQTIEQLAEQTDKEN